MMISQLIDKFSWGGMEMHWQLHLSHDDEAVGLHVFMFIFLSLSCIKPSSASSTKPTMTQVQIQFKCFSTMQSKDHEVLSISFEQFNKYSICPQKPATGGRNKTQQKQKQRDVWGGEAISSAPPWPSVGVFDHVMSLRTDTYLYY